jgi:hypothetical protein
MIGFVEYLWFTKDDIDWLERPLFERATIDSLPRQKALGTGMALTSLMRLEYQLLDDLRADSVPSMERLTRYAASFSARQLPGSKTALFTELMAARYYDHLRRKFSNYESLFGKALEEMEAVREEYSRVRAALAEPPPDYRV